MKATRVASYSGLDESDSKGNGHEPLLSGHIDTLNESTRSHDTCFRSGSVSGSTVNLCSATLGAGMLSIPFAFSKMGLIMGVVCLLYAAYITEMSIDMLVKSCNTTKCKTYEDMTVFVYGRWMGLLAEFSILTFCIGTAIAYIVAIGDILQIVLSVFDHLPAFCTREFMMFLFWSTVMFPLSLNERVNSIRFASLFGVCSIFFLALSTVYHSLRSIANDGFQVPERANMTILAGSPIDFLRACPVILFAFSCQCNVPAIYCELNQPSPRRMSRVTYGSLSICVCAYLLMGIFAYLDFGTAVQDNILKNFCLTTDFDPIILVAFLCITFSIVMAYPLNVLPARTTVDIVLRRYWQNEVSEDGEMSGTRRFWLTFCISGFSLIVALLVPDISILFGLMGGTSSSVCAFIIPGLLHLKLGKERIIGAWILVIGGILVGVLTTVATIYSLINDDQSNFVC